MVAQQKLKDQSSLDGGSPKSKLAMLKRSSTKAKGSCRLAAHSKGAPSANSIANSDDPFRFQGNGVDFKGKFIGERDVLEARGDVMCAEAMRLTKASIKATGSHKQRIVLNISLEGLKLKDDKSGSMLHNFPVSRISFIARDTTDARAFGFIFGTADGAYRFYGIKTAQTADQAVLGIRDMFQVVFEMKKKQVAEAKQKHEEHDNLTNSQREQLHSHATADGCRMEGGVAVADLLDLESELSNIERGFQQLQNMDIDEGAFAASFQSAHSGGGGSAFSDPFGDSFNPPPAPFTLLLPAAAAAGGWPAAPPPAAVAYQCTNPFATAAAVAVVGQCALLADSAPTDPFDTQPAHRLIHAINNTHSFALPAPVAQQQQQQQPPLPAKAPVVLPAAEINWNMPHKATSLKENTAPVADFAAHFNGGGNGDARQLQWDERPASTLEEGFNKLVDMSKLVSTSSCAGPEGAHTRKNPFEHILNPPKVPLNALLGSSASAPAFEPAAASAFPSSCKAAQNGTNGLTHQHHHHHANGFPAPPAGKPLPEKIAVSAADPFNDDFFS